MLYIHYCFIDIGDEKKSDKKAVEAVKLQP